MSHTMVKRILSVVVPLVSVTAVSGTAYGVDYYLRAEAFTKDLPNPSGGPDIPVPMWGFARDDGFEGTEIEPVSVPGPRLEVPSGDTTLTIHLDNNLTTVPISIVIPGQIATMTPVFFDDLAGRRRVRSFTDETDPGNTTEVLYTWTGLKPGTYLYHSGTHPQVQVQMGLYGGAVVNPTTAGQAYDDASSAYDAQVLLLYSEVDPVLHQQVFDGSYGDTGMTSTIDYNPKYFLVNGEPYTGTITPLPAGTAGDSVLIRFLNAGLRTHAPVLLGPRMRVIAEDGNLYPYSRDRCSLELPAGQTRDAIVEFSAAGTYPVYDRTLSLTNAGGSLPGGMLTYLQVVAP